MPQILTKKVSTMLSGFSIAVCMQERCIEATLKKPASADCQASRQPLPVCNEFHPAAQIAEWRGQIPPQSVAVPFSYLSLPITISLS